MKWRDLVFIPASTAILSRTTLREDVDAGLTQTGYHRVMFGVTVFDVEVDLIKHKGCSRDALRDILNYSSNPHPHLHCKILRNPST